MKFNVYNLIMQNDSIEIELQNKLKINGLIVDCSLSILKQNTYLITGENGVGKTSFVQYLKTYSREVFDQNKLCFTDQFPLTPLNEISYSGIKSVLNDIRLEKLDTFENNEHVLGHIMDVPIKSLSGGQNQLVKIFLSLFISGDIFIFDEPLQYLDTKNVTLFKRIICDLKSIGKTILIIEHRAELLDELIDNKIIFSKDEKLLIRNQSGS